MGNFIQSRMGEAFAHQEDKMREFLNPFPHPLLGAKDTQTVRWNAFHLQVVYELEIVSFLDAPTHRYAKGAYTDFLAIALNDYEIPMLLKGDVFSMSISYKEFVIALEELHPIIRKPLNSIGDGNIVIKFIKTSKQAMKILSITTKENTPELKQQAQKEYDKIRGKEDA